MGLVAVAVSCSVVNAPDESVPGDLVGGGTATGGSGGGGGTPGTNHPPVLTNLPGQATAIVRTTGHFIVEATDADGDALTFATASTTCPFPVAVSPPTGDVAFTCGSSPLECEAVVQVVDDGSPSASAEGTLQVICSNDVSFTSTPSSSAEEETEYVYQVTCVDPNGDPVTLSVASADTCAGILTDEGDGTGSYSFTPTEEQGGTSCVVGLVCAAGGDSVTQSGTVTIAEVNLSPTITNLPTTVTGAFNEAKQLQVVATDADLPANTLSFSLGGDTCSFEVLVSGDGLATWTCGAQVETCSAVVQAHDDGVPPATASDTLTIECAGVDCAGNGMSSLVIGGVLFCYTNQPGTCQDAHLRCEGLGQGYRLMCGDDWQPGYTGEGCGNAGAYTGYDLVNEYFAGSSSIGGYSTAQYNCVSGGLNMNCSSDVGHSPAEVVNGNYAFCSPKNYFTEAQDGPDFAQVCGN